MDTSGKYKKMCEKAIEIQGLFEGKRGDYYCERCDDTAKPLIFIEDIEWCGSYSTERIKKGKERFVWLPRQDQLQEIFNQTSNQNTYQLAAGFYQFVGSTRDFDSMEEAWLSFVMIYVYQKIWAGDDWCSPI